MGDTTTRQPEGVQFHLLGCAEWQPDRRTSRERASPALDDSITGSAGLARTLPAGGRTKRWGRLASGLRRKAVRGLPRSTTHCIEGRRLVRGNALVCSRAFFGLSPHLILVYPLLSQPNENLTYRATAANLIAGNQTEE